MRRVLSALVPLVLLIAPLFGLGRRSLDGSVAGRPAAELADQDDDTDGSGPSAGLAVRPTLTVHYFRGSGRYTEARFALDLHADCEEPSEIKPRARRLFGRIRRLQTNGLLSAPASEVIIEHKRWAAHPSDPSLDQSSALLLPGRYWLELFIENQGTSATIDRILEVPSFPADGLGISSVVAVSDPEPSARVSGAVRMLSPGVDRRFRRGQTFVVLAEAYLPADLEASTSFSVEFVLSRGGEVVQEKSHNFPCGEPNALLVERFETKSLEPGPYLLQTNVSPPIGEKRVSSRLELSIDDASIRPSRAEAPNQELETAEIPIFCNLDEML